MLLAHLLPTKSIWQNAVPLWCNYKFRSHLHHSVLTLILNCKVSRLARLTGHMTLSDTTNYYSSRPHNFPRKYKSSETFWRSLIHKIWSCKGGEYKHYSLLCGADRSRILFKMWEPAYQTKWHHVPNYCNHDIIKLSYRRSCMIYMFLIQLHEATKHYPNVIMVSFQNQHWILEQEGHNECWIQWHIRVLGTNKQVSLWNVPGREPLQDMNFFHFRDCLRPWNVGKPLSLDAAFCPWTFHWILSPRKRQDLYKQVSV